MAKQELPGCAAARKRQTNANHHGAENHRPAHADGVGGAAHDDAAEPLPEPGKSARKRRDRTRAAELGRNGFERDDQDPWRAE